MQNKLLKRSSLLMLIDAATVIAGYYLTFLAILPRYLWPEPFHIFRYTFLIVMVVYMGVFTFGGIYQQMWRYADAREYGLCMTSSIIAGGIFIIVAGVIRYHVPIRIQLVSPFIIGVMIVTSRLVYKLVRQDRTSLEARGQDRTVSKRKRLAIVGAGESGALLYQEIKSNPNIRYDLMFFADDNSSKIGRKLFGVPILGPIDKISQFVEERNIDEIIIAMAAVTGEQKKRVVEACNESRADVKILPSIDTTLSRGEGQELDPKDLLMGQLRKIDVEDLLGRDPIKVDDTDISSYIEGHNVLVTGGGGSIGSELCRQIVDYGAKKLIILDNHENGAYETEQELIRDYGFKPQVEILDVKDKERIERLFLEEKAQGSPIETVFHAAAHKHVPLMEHNPESAIKNNILGTRNVAELANQYGVKRMILISTDKAVNPTNVMGATKRACELVVQSMNQVSQGTIFTAVRFGNVLGSNGSVIPLFKKQIEKGGPVTVTHPDIIRYFMTIPEAVSLVLNAGGLAQGGEIFVLDMGDPVKIIDLAKNLIKLAGLELGKDIDIVFTGLRPGEKLFEELLMEEEGLKTTKSEKIFIGQALNLEADHIFQKIDRINDLENDKEKQKDWLKDLVTTYKETNCARKKSCIENKV